MYDSQKMFSVLIYLTTFNSKEMLGQILQLENAHEAAWRRLNPILSCDQNKMKLKAMGPGAAYLQLDMGIATVKSVLSKDLCSRSKHWTCPY